MQKYLARFPDIIQKLTLTSVSGREFILTEQLKTWLNSSCVEGDGDRTILQGLFNYTVANCKSAELCIKPWESNSVLLFCILLQLDLGHLLSEFRDMSDDALPLTEQDLRRLPDGPEQERLFAGFQKIQWLYCPARFNLDVIHTWTPEFISPICTQNLLANGRTASVYEVVIPDDFLDPGLRAALVHSRFEDLGIGPGWYYRLAMKTYNEWNNELGGREKDLCQSLKHSQNFITPLLAFTTVPRDSNLQDSISSKVGYCLLSELAEMDLHGYFTVKNPPVTCLDVRKFWSNLSHIVDGIRELHQSRQASDNASNSRILVGYHHDIKPSNILVSRGRFKLCDFGFAAFIPADGSYIPASTAMGTLSYGPPAPNIYANTGLTVDGLLKFDIWSLGCVFSEAATWVVLGTSGVEKFNRLRSRVLDGLCTAQERKTVESQDMLRKHPTRRGDYFHDGVDVLEIVTSWHKYLRNVIRRSDTTTSKMLDLIDEGLLVSDMERRINAEEIYARMREVTEGMGTDDGFAIDKELAELLGEELSLSEY